MKELHLTEGRGTGFPTIHEELKKNGSPSAVIDVDDEHTYFIIRIPCHPEFVCEELSMDKEGHILPIGEVWSPDVTDNVTDEVAVTDDVMGGGASDVTDDVNDSKVDIKNDYGYCGSEDTNFTSSGWRIAYVKNLIDCGVEVYIDKEVLSYTRTAAEDRNFSDMFKVTAR